MTATIVDVGDNELVARALRGEQAAVGEIYDRYADAIYSFCRSRLRHDADAADATQDTFVKASTRLAQLRDPSKLRPWLYAIARNQIIATGRASSRLTGDDAMELIAAPDSEPDIDLLRVEAAHQLWDAADGLSTRDHEVLELHLRHGLVGQGLADALGVNESHANVLLSRTRDRVATSLGGLLVARSGRDECLELDLLLGGWDGRFTMDIRSKVTRHVRACDICEETRTRVLASGVSFGVLPIIPAPSILRGRTVGKMSDALGIDPTRAARSDPLRDGNPGLRFSESANVSPPTSTFDGWEWRADGFPGGVVENARRGLVLLSAAAAFVVLVMLGAVTAIVFNDGDDVETVAAIQVAGAVELADTTTTEPEDAGAVVSDTETTTTTETSTTLTSSSIGAPTTSGPASTAAALTTTSAAATTSTQASSTTAPTATTESTTAPTTTSSTTTSSTTTSSTTTSSTTTSSTTTSSTTTSSTTTTEAPRNRLPVFGRVAALPRTVEVQRDNCPGQTSTVLAQVTDPDGEIVSVVAIWSAGKGGATQTSLTPVAGATANTYGGSIGAWLVPGAQTAEIIAIDDSGGSRSTVVTVSVTDCLPLPG